MGKTIQSYDKRKEEIHELRAVIQNLETRIAWMDTSFLLEKDGDRKTLYGYLREHPVSARFIYKKYESFRPVLNELCDPENPLYLPEVAEQLKDRFRIKDMEEEIRDLKEANTTLLGQKNNLVKEITNLEKQQKELKPKVDSLTVDMETLNTQIKNLNGKEGVESVNRFLADLISFVTKVNESKGVLNSLTDTISLNRDMSLKLMELSKRADELMNFLKSNRLGNIDLECMKSELEKEGERLQREMDSTKMSVQAVEEKNIEKKLVKISESINNGLGVLRRFEGRTLKDEHIPGISESFVDAQKLTSHLLDQVRTIRRRERDTEKEDGKKRYNDIPSSIPESSIPEVRIRNETPSYIPPIRNKDPFDTLKELNDEREGQKKGIFRRK